MNNRGFSLVELLVVMGVIGLLTGIVVPATRRGLETARATQCLSNLRQMALAAEAYVQSHGGRYPPARLDDRPSGRAGAWDFMNSVGGVAPRPGWLWDGAGDARIQQCPSFRGASNWEGDPYTGYNYNASYVGGDYAVRPDGKVLGQYSARVAQVRNPTECALFGDGEYADGANKFMRSPLPGRLDDGFSGRAAGTQGYRHLGRTQVAFADGHASAWTNRAVVGENEALGYFTVRTGFLATDNRYYDLD